MIEMLMPDLTSVSDDPGDWRERGSCRLTHLSPDVWFPIAPDDSDAELAKSICRACMVKPQCLRDSLANKTIVGIWGGYDERDRARLRRRQREAKG